ncbi:MAG: AbrB/MazE/SpoVT family DNA-binding domain-containing protein [Alphaproteobacteria bacterium]|nr:AbrB/MazE/SpoVT family DNA-binding domain-containing protein [Alphaproteobacteria bacterium]
MERASVFKNNKSQAIRLPKRVALPPEVRQVDIVALGRARLIVPAGTAWESWFAEGPVTSDFMVDRDQPDDQDRDPFAP